MTTTAPRWDLTPWFTGSDDRALSVAVEAVRSGVDRLCALYDEHAIGATEPRAVEAADVTALDAVLDATNTLLEQAQLVDGYLYLLVTTDSRDDDAAALAVELQSRTAVLGPLSKRLASWLAALGTDAFVAASDTAAAHRFYLERSAQGAEFQMSQAEEALAADLSTSGPLAWARLHGDLSSQLPVHVARSDGTTTTVPMAMARGMATNPDAALRRAAYEGELAAWEGAAVSFAAALNGAKGTLGVLNARRGFDDDLAPVLRSNNVDRATLDAMTDAVVAALPDFRRYLRTKARLLGHDGALPWYDLFAPLDGAGTVSWDHATELVQAAFSGYSSHLGDLAQRAFAQRWIDAEIRDGKRGGAYCADVQGDVSRIMMNFDDSHEAVSTLAHELGHAYHNTTLAIRTPIQRRLPMALAETASIFCETLLFEHLLGTASTPAERLGLYETQLTNATQVVVDIHSRFLFESELCRRRKRTTLSVNDLNTVMLDAQEAAYGDGLHPELRHPYMWAVKPHYFTAFYNWPYTFGLLFGLGLYARHAADPEAFRAGYDDLLSSAGMADAVDLGERFGIDVRDEGFWASSLAVLRGHVDGYEALASEATSSPDSTSKS